MSKKKLTQEKLKELLKYDPDTGVFTWNMYRQSNALKGNVAGCLNAGGYNRISILGKRYLSSRLAFLYMLGYFPEHEAEHKNRVTNDDRWVNLREATHMCNLRNVGVKSHNTSGVTGVGYDNTNSKWMAYITIMGSFKCLSILRRIKTKCHNLNRIEKYSLSLFLLGKHFRPSRTIKILNQK